jgi:hypothetical protein
MNRGPWTRNTTKSGGNLPCAGAGKLFTGGDAGDRADAHGSAS